jgi:uncharacterized protein (UPF0261 family)
MSSSVYAIATMDTKEEEILYVAECIRSCGVSVKVVNAGTLGSSKGSQGKADVSQEEVAECHPKGAGVVLGNTDRGVAVQAMSDALTEYMLRENQKGSVLGVIGIGGGGGTSLITRPMRALPIGLPKLMVSTLASGNVAPYVDCSDITMMHAVVDVAGINKISSVILGNAAHAIAGMAKNQEASKANTASSSESDNKATTIAMTMFGVTTPCVDAVRKDLEKPGQDCLVFHATGSGGRAMEKLVEAELIDAVLDITTTEVCDEVVGGVLSAGPQRFDVILEKKIPYVMSLGALDMVNFGGRETVPDKFDDRTFYIHNSEVTLMRTTPEECVQIAQWIAKKVNTSTAPVTILIPEKGVSMLSVEGQPFHDPEADKALFETLEKEIQQTEIRQIKRLPYSINDAEFSEAILAEYKKFV